jgi:hypothetical protein
MRLSRFGEEQIIAILREQEAEAARRAMPAPRDFRRDFLQVESRELIDDG